MGNEKLNKSLTKLEKQLVKEDNLDDINRIVELFNVNLQKKNIIRSAKLSDVQDKVVDQILQRINLEPEEFSNEDLIKYHKIIQETLDKTDTTMDNVKIPTIQINQQVNVDKIMFDSDSRKRILAAVHDILDTENAIDLDLLTTEEE